MTQQEQNAWDGTLGFGLLLVILLEIPMCVVVFGGITFHHPVFAQQASIGIGLIGLVLMGFLFVRTAGRVMYNE